MNKKFEHHKEYPEAVYKDRVYKWFTDSTSTLSDADLQKFVNLCMKGNLTFQCADEIDFDDPDISIIDHLLMNIASEKNDELINTYTDEIDWDTDYVEKYSRSNNMNKKLEARIARLERLLSHKNEAFVRRVDPNKTIKFNKNDFDNVSYVMLYVDGDDIDSIETAGYGIVEVLKRLMLELQSYINSNIKGFRNSELNAWLEFYDIDDSMAYRSDLPIIYTDSKGNVMIENVPRRGLNSIDKLSFGMFDKHCLV